MEAELHLFMKNDLGEVSRLTAKCEELLTSHSVANSKIYKVNLILEEILTNIIKYAYQDEETHHIQVWLRLAADAIRIEFQDDGTEFDPIQAPEPDLSLPIEDVKVGGLGLHLVRANAERLEYKRDGSKNCLIVHLSNEPLSVQAPS